MGLSAWMDFLMKNIFDTSLLKIVAMKRPSLFFSCGFEPPARTRKCQAFSLAQHHLYSGELPRFGLLIPVMLGNPLTTCWNIEQSGSKAARSQGTALTGNIGSGDSQGQEHSHKDIQVPKTL